MGSIVPTVTLEGSGSGNACFFCPKERVVCVNNNYTTKPASRSFCRGKREKAENVATWNAFEKTVRDYKGPELADLTVEETGRSLAVLRKKGSRLKPRHRDNILSKAAASGTQKEEIVIDEGDPTTWTTDKEMRDKVKDRGNSTATRTTEMDIVVGTDGKKEIHLRRSIIAENIPAKDVKDVTNTGTLTTERMMNIFSESMNR